MIVKIYVGAAPVFELDNHKRTVSSTQVLILNITAPTALSMVYSAGAVQ